MARRFETMIPRRTVLQAGVAGGIALAMPEPSTPVEQSTTIGVIADLHHGLEPTALQRLDSFAQSVAEHQPDSILQLGDFNYGKPDRKECMEIWEQFKGPRYHVLGNHDLDVFDKAHMLDAWQMPARFYSFDQGGWHFVVLDRNHIKQDGRTVAYERSNYYVDASLRGFADPEQLEWLKQDLAKTDRPTAVFVHQGLGMPDQPAATRAANQAIETVLAEANRGKETPRVVACFCGHHHIDRYHFSQGTHFVWINSASYHWVGQKYGRMAVYTEPLYCFVSFQQDGTIEIKGRESDWQEPTPKQRGYPNPDRLNTYIRSRVLPPGRTGNPGT